MKRSTSCGPPMQSDEGHPYAWRTWLRGRLPWFLIDLGFAGKGRNCDTVGAWHRWYNEDNINSACYHCRQIRPGRLWEQPDDAPEAG